MAGEHRTPRQRDEAEDVRWDHDYLDAFEERWKSWRVDGEWLPVSRGWALSVQQWADRGLELDELLDLVDYAMERETVPFADKWRYLCGCAWRTIERGERW
jgi:hypothetical protein